jgi:hypothetical protein
LPKGASILPEGAEAVQRLVSAEKAMQKGLVAG